MTGTADPLGDLPFELPEGGYVALGDEEPRNDGTSALWVSHGPPSPRTWAQARRAHSETGWWPLLLRVPDYEDESASEWVDSELFFPDRVDTGNPEAGKLLAAKWGEYTAVYPDDTLTPGQREVVTAPFGAAWPGLAAAGRFEAREAEDTADGCAAELAAGPRMRLGLARASSGAAAVGVLGWDGPVNYGLDPADTAAILADWQRRFGVRVLMVHDATLTLSTATVPVDEQQALRLAAEHFAFCPDNIWQSTVETLADYARKLVGRKTWSFWWD